MPKAIPEWLQPDRPGGESRLQGGAPARVVSEENGFKAGRLFHCFFHEKRPVKKNSSHHFPFETETET